MRAAVFAGPRSIVVTDRPDPVLASATDALVRVLVTCVCGSDLWPYRGETKRPVGGPIGHEFVGVVEEIGAEVRDIRVGDVVVAPFTYSDGTCANCRAGMQSVCSSGGIWGLHGVDGGQGEAVRVPLADGTLVRVPGHGHSDATLASLLALSDVMGTGHHAATSAGVREGSVVAVVGDGAVGLCGVIAARRLGASRILALSRNPARQELARAFGATDVLAERGDEATARVLDLTDGVGADAVLECVGTAQAMETAFAIARPGSVVGFVGVPHGVEVPVGRMFARNVGLRGGIAPVRASLPALLDDVLEGTIEPGRVFDFTTDVEGIPEAYAAMDERRAVKALVRVGSE